MPRDLPDHSPVAPALELGDRGAELSDCGCYRYRLWRTWSDAPPVLFVMLNPSTADADVDDPTIRRCVGFARRLGAGGIEVVNLYAWRATDPADLPRHETPRSSAGTVAVAPEADPFANDRAMYDAAARCDRIIVAWGADLGPVPSRARAVVEQILYGRRVEALALTKAGQPRHPLYVRGDVKPIPYRGDDA